MNKEVFRKIRRGAAIAGLFASTALLSGCTEASNNTPTSRSRISPSPTPYPLAQAVREAGHQGCIINSEKVEVCADPFGTGYAFSYFPNRLERPETGLVYMLLQDFQSRFSLTDRYHHDITITRSPFYRFKIEMDRIIGTRNMNIRAEIGRADKTAPERTIGVALGVSQLPGDRTLTIEWSDWDITQVNWNGIRISLPSQSKISKTSRA